jgi:hypothetical protein
MSASRGPNDLRGQAGAPSGHRPAPESGWRPSRLTQQKAGFGLLAVVIVATVLGCARGGATAGSTSAPPSIAGTWVGSGTIFADLSGPIAFFLDLSVDANQQITGTSDGCASQVPANSIVTGAPSGTAGDYAMDFKTHDLGPTEHTLHVSAHVSGSTMTLSGTDTGTSPPTNVRVTLTRGERAAYVALCGSQPTFAPPK